MNDFFSLPYWVVMVIVAAAAVTAACCGQILFRRLVPYRDLVAHNDVAGFMISIIGVIYAVLLAFVVIVVWQQYNDSDDRYGQEVAAMSNLYAYAGGLPASQRDEIRAMVRHYIRLMVDEEWPAMQAGGGSAGAAQVLSDLAEAIVPVRGTDVQTALLRMRLAETLQQAADNRRRRLFDNQQTLPPVLWTTLIVGAIVTVSFGYLFGVERFRAHLAMTASVAALVAVSFALLIELDFPFRRDSAIPPTRWADLQHVLGR
jgi:hypothetical protein